MLVAEYGRAPGSSETDPVSLQSPRIIAACRRQQEAEIPPGNSHSAFTAPSNQQFLPDSQHVLCRTEQLTREPHLLPGTSTSGNVPACVLAVGNIDSVPRNPHPMAPANPALVRVSSDDLISFQHPPGLSAAVDAAVPVPAVPTLPSSRAGKACTATRKTWLECK